MDSYGWLELHLTEQQQEALKDLVEQDLQDLLEEEFASNEQPEDEE